MMIASARILRPHRVLPRGWSRTLKCFERPDIKSRPRTAKTFWFGQRGEVSRGGLEPPTSTLCSVQCARMSEPNSGTQEERYEPVAEVSTWPRTAPDIPEPSLIGGTRTQLDIGTHEP